MSAKEVDNSRFAFQRMLKLYRDDELSDIQLKVGSKLYNTHRLVLCMCSDVFRTMLTNSTWPESRSKRIVLQEEDDCVEVFEEFLMYLYNGHVVLETATVLPLLTLADKYNIADLSKSCLEYMCTHCLPDSQGYIIFWLQYATICGLIDLEAICRNYIMYNFGSVMHMNEFSTLDEDVLVTFLESSELVIADEYSLYMAMKAWLGKHTEDINNQTDNSLFYKIMSHVRFPMMQLQQLALLELDPFIKKFKDFYLEKIFTALKYHTIPASRRQITRAKPSHGNYFRPRNYTSETWSTVIAVDNLASAYPGEVRGAFFTTPVSCSETDQHNLCDWHVHLYPKGIKFDSCILIGVPTNLTVAGEMFPNVRLAIATNCDDRRRVIITVLFMATGDGDSEFVSRAVTRSAIFERDAPLFNFNNLVPYRDLVSVNSPYRYDKDSFKITIIIRPDNC